MSGTLYFLVGPTAAGKTELCLRWAESQPGRRMEILSCDSLQVYRGMDIGTAKPSREELGRVVHHGINLVEPGQRFTIVDYVEYARKVVEEARQRGVDLLVSGGSGFYLKSFFAPVLDPVEVPESVSRSVRTLFRERGHGAMVARIRALNPDGLGTLEVRNPRRVMRALERCLASGRSLLELQEEFQEQPLPYPDYRKQVCLACRSRGMLEERIARRTSGMLEAGLVDEVRALMDGPGFLENPSAARAIGYRETVAFLQDGSRDLSKLESEINTNTLKLVKKQRTWFRSQIPVDQELNLDELSLEKAVDRLFAG